MNDDLSPVRPDSPTHPQEGEAPGADGKRPSDADAASYPPGYTPPAVRSLGTLPQSTGMPLSDFLPGSPER